MQTTVKGSWEERLDTVVLGYGGSGRSKVSLWDDITLSHGVQLCHCY